MSAEPSTLAGWRTILGLVEPAGTPTVPRHPLTPTADRATELRELIRLVEQLSPMQMHVVRAIVERFALGYRGELLRTDFLHPDAFDYFGMRLSAHHAYSGNLLKKENFEHILEAAFRMAGARATRPKGMTHRGADLVVDGHCVAAIRMVAGVNLDGDCRG